MKSLRWLWLWALLTGYVTAHAQPDSTARPIADAITADTTQPERTSLWRVSGYVKYLNTISIPTLAAVWAFDGQIHNRVNLRYVPTGRLTVAVSLRNRLFFGQSLTQNPLFLTQATQVLDRLRLGGTVFGGPSVVLYSVFDRAYVDYRTDRWQVTAGKQRINWAKSYVWNPNDLFNAYSFFDFDYEERPGSDALLIRRYTSTQSSVEVAGSLGRRGRAGTLAALYRFNSHQTDGQVLLGLSDSSWAVGAGGAGQLGKAGIKGEATYFGPTALRPGALVADVSVDYTWPNTFTLRAEAILNTQPLRAGTLTFLTQPVTARSLINNYVSVFGSVSYELTPLFVASAGGIWNIDDGSYFANPSVNLNLTDNVELLVTAQLLGGRGGSLFSGVGSFVFTRLKWSL